MTDFLVKRDDLRECRIAESAPPEIEPGQALLRVDTFGLTANNVTYAVFGEAMHYWDFFPAEDGWGRVPMWGFAEVERSEADGVEPGDAGVRLPAALLAPGRRPRPTPARRGFVDGSPHRAALPSAYHRYLATGADPFYRADTEEIQMLLRPLFFTSFLIDDQLDDEGLATRGPVRDLQRLEQDGDRRRLHARPARRGRAGRPDLAAQRRVRRGAGDLRPHRRLRRDRLARAPAPPPSSTSPATATVRHAVHSHYGDRLVHSMTVGVTHWEELGAGARRAARARPRPSSSPPTGSSSAPRTGAAPASRPASPTPGTRSASGPAAGSRRSAARASTPSATPTSTCSRAASIRRTPTCSPSPRSASPSRMTLYVWEHVQSPKRVASPSSARGGGERSGGGSCARTRVRA